MKTQDIQQNIQLIDEALAWADAHSVQTFPVEVFKAYKRTLRAINESGKKEDKTSKRAEKQSDGVGVMMSVADVLKVMLDAYYSDVDARGDLPLLSDVINQKVNELLPQIVSDSKQDFVNEDDILALNDYMHRVVGSKSAAVYQSDFCKLVAPKISKIACKHWPALFSFLWNQNASFTSVFAALVAKFDTQSGNAEPTADEVNVSQIRDGIVDWLRVYHKNDGEKNATLQKTIGDMRAMLDLNIGQNQELFGKILDDLMVQSDDIRKIVYDALVLQEPEESANTIAAIQMIRRQCEIDMKDSAEQNTEKLLAHYSLSEEDLGQLYEKQGFSIADVVSVQKVEDASNADGLVQSVVSFWMQYINNNVAELRTMLPHAEEITYALMALFQNFNVAKTLTEGVTQYQSLYGGHDSVNAVADFITFELNKFVGTFGRAYMGFDEVKKIQEKATACNVKIADISPLAMTAQFKRQDVKQALTVLEQSSQIDFSNMVTLLNLSFWDNFPKWENFVTMGLLYASEVEQFDSAAGKQIGDILRKTEKLYGE